MPEINAGDTAWVLMATALVMLMTPGLGFFYGGLVRGKNVLATLMQSFFMACLISVVWVLWGYSLAFGPDKGGLIGGLDYLGFEGVGGTPLDGMTIPHSAFATFQMMFAVITPALITGAFAERKRFKAFVLFSLLWSTFVYSPLAHWVWASGGWIFEYGAMDFAGGTVVHISSGVSALVCALVLGKRVGFGAEKMEPHNLPFTVLGGALLWFGWFGFNAGSAVGSGAISGFAFLNTIVATAAAMIAWLLVERFRDGHPTSLGAASGVVAGLVAITPACSAVTPVGALAVGAVAGVLCALAVGLKFRFGFDDSLDVVGVHLVGGLVGTLLVGFLATEAAPAGVAGLFYGGGFDQLWRQAVGAFAVLIFSFVLSLIIAYIVKAIFGLRATEENEVAGLDESEHAETAYDFSTLRVGGGLGAQRPVVSGTTAREPQVTATTSSKEG
jgi:Amt family ammonium transporter